MSEAISTRLTYFLSKAQSKIGAGKAYRAITSACLILAFSSSIAATTWPAYSLALTSVSAAAAVVAILSYFIAIHGPLQRHTSTATETTVQTDAQQHFREQFLAELTRREADVFFTASNNEPRTRMYFYRAIANKYLIAAERVDHLYDLRGHWEPSLSTTGKRLPRRASATASLEVGLPAAGSQTRFEVNIGSVRIIISENEAKISVIPERGSIIGYSAGNPTGEVSLSDNEATAADVTTLRTVH